MLLLTIVAEGPNLPLLEDLETSAAEIVERGGMGGTGGIGIGRLRRKGGEGEEPVILSPCPGAGAVGATRGLTNGVVGSVPDTVPAGAAIGSTCICDLADGGEKETRSRGEVAVSTGRRLLTTGWGTVMGGGRYFTRGGEDDCLLPFFKLELLDPESARLVVEISLETVKSNGISSKRGIGSEISYLRLSDIGLE